jgi:hypothetical protein
MSSYEREPKLMEVKNYTNIWTEEKKLYSIYEWTLPAPVGFRQIGLFALGAIIWCPIMAVLNVNIGTALGFFFWFGPPVLLAIVGNKPIFEAKSIFQYIRSIVSYLFQPKVIFDGRGVNIKQEKVVLDSTNKSNTPKHTMEIIYWTRDEEDVRN